MMLFQPPSATRFDVHFTLAGILIRVHPLFWVMTLLFGAAAGDPVQLIIWVLVVFVSIVIHEMGHALTMRRFGVSAEVVLYLGGGLAVPRPERFGGRWISVGLTTGQRILISLAGPGAGFVLASLVMILVIIFGGSVHYTPLYGILPSVSAVLPGGTWLTYALVGALLWVNFFWGVINLVPVQPLDGGNVARELITNADPLDGERKALWISVIAGAAMTVIGMTLMQSTYITLLYGFLTIQSYQKVRNSLGSYY